MSATSEVFAREGRSLLFKSTVAVALGSAALLAKYAIHKASSSSYDGMDSIVSFSSRMIAGRFPVVLLLHMFPFFPSLLLSFSPRARQGKKRTIIGLTVSCTITSM